MRETYATVHRGVYQRSADMTLAYRGGAAAGGALHRRAGGGGGRLRPRRDRGDQPRRAELGRDLPQARRPHPAVDAGASFQHRAVAARRRAHRRRDRRRAADRGRPDRSRRDGGDADRAAQDGRARPCLERARLGARRAPRRRAGAQCRRDCCSSTAARRCRACRSTSLRSAAISTSSPATSFTARPASACCGAAAELLDAMPPCQGGGAMIDKVTFAKTTFAPPPARFEAGTPHIVGVLGLARGDRLCRSDRLERDPGA